MTARRMITQGLILLVAIVAVASIVSNGSGQASTCQQGTCTVIVTSTHSALQYSSIYTFQSTTITFVQSLPANTEPLTIVVTVATSQIPPPQPPLDPWLMIWLLAAFVIILSALLILSLTVFRNPPKQSHST